MLLVRKGPDLREALRSELAIRERKILPPRERGRAAVLIALFEREDETHVWLLRRPDAMRRHAGQVAFPGGKSEPEDPSLRETALREALEELSILPDSVDVLGCIDDYVTITGYTVTPFVGWVPADLRVEPNPEEVSRAFSAPLSIFFEGAVPAIDRARDMIPRFSITHDGERVWGATATMARSLARIVRDLP